MNGLNFETIDELKDLVLDTWSDVDQMITDIKYLETELEREYKYHIFFQGEDHKIIQTKCLEDIIMIKKLLEHLGENLVVWIDRCKMEYFLPKKHLIEGDNE